MGQNMNTVLSFQPRACLSAQAAQPKETPCILSHRIDRSRAPLLHASQSESRVGSSNRPVTQTAHAAMYIKEYTKIGTEKAIITRIGEAINRIVRKLIKGISYVYASMKKEASTEMVDK